MLFVPHVGQGGADDIHWDPQPGGISKSLNNGLHVTAVTFELWDDF